MSPESRCTHCGAALVADAPQGLCPACLLQRGLDAETGSHDGGSQPSAGDYVAPTPAELAPHFPDLEILELLGQGGMGVVYKARQKKLNRLIALKILAGKVGPDPAFADRFTREARALAMLNHPHIVTVYDFGQTGGLYYFLMEFVDGVNLRQLLDNGKLAPTAALAIVPQICEALQYAHDKGIVHRDIKPANILLDTSGRVKIADFGVAKLMGQKSEEGPLTGEGHVMGTPHYMAPEQVEHPLEVDHRADIFSLGVVFYQMLTGELPLGRFGPPSRKVEIDVRLDEVVLRALEKEPDRRYQQASEVKTRVEKIVSTPGALPASLTANQKAWQSPTMGWGHFVGYLFGITFTSPLAYKLANLSALGFLAFLAFFKYVPLPGSHWFSGFAGLSGLFGLIGVAFMIEMVTRYKASTAAGNAPTASSDDDAQRQTRQVIQRPSISLWALVATGAAGLLIVLLGTWVIVRDKDGKEVARIMVPDGGTAQVKTGPAKEKRGAMPTRQRSDYGTKKSPGSRDTTASAEQPTPDNGIPTKLHPLATSALLDERPQLRFLAWQDEWTTNQPRGAFHADGTEVTDPSELRLLRIIGATLCDASGTAEGKGNPRFLHLWFSHPLIDEQSMNQVTLLDGAGQPVPLGAGGMFASGAREVDDSSGHLGWLTDTLCPGDNENIPASLTMRLRYTLGPWKQQRQFAPDERGIIALGNGSQFNAIGQDLEGKAFFSIAVDMKQDSARQFGVVAVTKDGRELQPSGFNRGGGNGEAVHVQRFSFATPLTDVAHFRLDTRDVRTAEFPNVTLQPKPLSEK